MGRKVLYAVLTIVFGAFAGAFCWAFFFLMNLGIDLLWNALPAQLAAAGLPAVLYPVAFCAIGGVCIGLFAKRFGAYPESMNEVMAKVKETSRYEYDHLGSSFFGALLPLLFGGSIGPEAGLTGVIAGLCTWVGDRLRFVGAEMRELAESGTAAVISAIFATPLFGMVVPVLGEADESEGLRSVSEVRLGVPKALKAAVYVLAVAGALGMMALLGSLFGGEGGLPHFSEVSVGVPEFVWLVPLVLVGAFAGWTYFPFGALARRISAAMGERPVAKAVLAGCLLGLAGVALPFAMFAGESQTEELSLAWTELPVIALMATCFVKVLVTQLCLNLGWHGGHFFPIIFAGIALGYGMAAIAGIDPVFSLCAVTAALMGAVMRQPLMAAALLLLVFPLASAPIMFVSAAVGSLFPVPKSWLGK